jgi:hypothetical protein
MPKIWKKCDKCKARKEISCFFKREDRNGFYAFCNDCMTEQGREPDYPAFDKRGGGSLKLEPRD